MKKFLFRLMFQFVAQGVIAATYISDLAQICEAAIGAGFIGVLLWYSIEAIVEYFIGDILDTQFQDQDTFWLVVQRCLEEFHGLSSEDAKKKCLSARSSFDSEKSPKILQKYVNESAFWTACLLARKFPQGWTFAKIEKKFANILGQVKNRKILDQMKNK